MNLTVLSSFVAAALGGLGVMAYRHKDRYLPFSSGLISALLLAWGASLGVSVTIATIKRRVGHNLAAPDLAWLTELQDVISPLSTVCVFALIGLFILRHIPSAKDH